MIKSLKLCAMIFGAALVFGCGQKSGLTGSEPTAALQVKTVAAAVPENNVAAGKQLVRKAKSAIGTPYVYGGSAPGGFDCSGLVKWAYNSVGVKLPRTAREQASVGKKVNDVKDMRAGDIVAFRHPKRGYHTGIYVGDGKFVHSPRRRTTVRINSLSDPYFKSTLLGARRVSLDGSENLIAQSEGRLRDYVAEKSQLSLAARNLEKIRKASKRNDAQVARKNVRNKATVAKASKTSGKTVAAKTSGRSQQAKVVAKKNSRNEISQAKDNSKKKSTIASQASKIKSLKAVTGKRANTKNGDAHDKLAKASKKTSNKAVSMLSSKAHKPAQKARNRS